MSYAEIMQIAWGFAGGVVSCLLCYGVLALKLFRLQLALGVVQQALLALRNKGANEVRQTRKQEMDQFLQSTMAHKTEHYANDPPWSR